jgi:hypothetical protein
MWSKISFGDMQIDVEQDIPRQAENVGDGQTHWPVHMKEASVQEH